LVFNRWYADMSYMGIAIDWEEMLWDARKLTLTDIGN
jgi:hypothetical protein